MKKVLFLLLFVLNTIPVYYDQQLSFSSTSQAHAGIGDWFRRLFHRDKGIACPPDVNAGGSTGDGVLHGFFSWLRNIFGSDGEEVSEKVSQLVIEGGGGTGEGMGNTSPVNGYGLDWGIFTGSGIVYYNPPPGELNLTQEQLNLLSRLAYYYAEYELLNPGMDQGYNRSGYYLTYGDDPTRFYNNSRITLPVESSSIMHSMKLHYDGDFVADPGITYNYLAEPDNPLPSGSYTWYRNGTQVSAQPSATFRSGVSETHIQVKDGQGQVAVDLTLDIYQGGYTPQGSNRVYVTPGGTPIVLPAGARIDLLQIDNSVYTDGALFGFFTSDGSEYIFREGNHYQNVNAGTPRYTQCFKVIKVNGQRAFEPTPSEPFTYPVITGGQIQAIRVRRIKENGQCKVVEELVNYTVGAATPLTVTGAYVPQNTDIETAPLISVISTTIVPCRQNGLPGSDEGLLDGYYNSHKDELKGFLDHLTKNKIKYYLFDCVTGKAKYVVSNDGASTLSAAEADAATAKFNSGSFGAADEDIAIKGCIEDGKWKYDVKYNPTKLSPHPKTGPILPALMDELKRQSDDEVRKLRTPGQHNDAESELVENGEQFYKASMDLLESVAAIYDVGKDVINTGALPEKMWDAGRRTQHQDGVAHAAYEKSPFRAPALVGGGADQLIDETLGGVQLLKTGLEVVRHPRESAAGLWQGIKNLDGTKLKQIAADGSGLTNYQQGGDRAVYQGGKHAVQLAMIVAGPVKLLAEGKDVLAGTGKEMTGIQKFVPDGSTNHPAAGALKNAADNNKLIKNIDDGKLVTQNVDNGQTVAVVIEKNAADAEVYKLTKDDYKNPDGTVPDDNSFEQMVQQDATDLQMPAHTTRPPDYPDEGLPDANVSYHPQGKKNIGWNEELNRLPLVSNHKYVTRHATFHTDATGKVTKVEIKKLEKDPNFDYHVYRNQHQQSKSVRKKGGSQGIDPDQGGHLLGNQFGGPGEQINLVPMKKSLNQPPGTWAQMEQEWAGILSNGGTVTNVNIEITYGSNGRPTSFYVEATVNNIPKDYPHTN